MCCACFTGKPDSVFNTAVWIEKINLSYYGCWHIIYLINIYITKFGQ